MRRKKKTRKKNAYEFKATYSSFDGQSGGFFIDILNGTKKDTDKKCYWFLYIRHKDGILCRSDDGVSDAKITKEVAGIVWRFEKYQKKIG